MAVRKFALAALTLAAAGTAGAKDGAPSRLFPYYEEDTGVLRLAQAVHVGTRDEIAGAQRHYRYLLETGIPEVDIGDGRLIVVRVHCCGGRIEEDQSLWAYVPTSITVQQGDFVEIRMGRVPTERDPGVVNTVTAVRQAAAETAVVACRWEPDNPSLWMRIVHCDGIEQQGWVQRSGARKMWYLPAGAAAPPAVPAPSGDTLPAPPGPETEQACYLVAVRPTLRGIVGETAAQTSPPTAIRFAGEPGDDTCALRLDLEFTSVVDRTSQRRNRDGAVIGGPATLLLGAITPWSCPTIHTLRATLSRRDGEQVRSFTAEVLQKRVGTMLACAEVAEPKDSIAKELLGKVLGDIAGAATSPPVQVEGTPAAPPEPP